MGGTFQTQNGSAAAGWSPGVWDAASNPSPAWDSTLGRATRTTSKVVAFVKEALTRRGDQGPPGVRWHVAWALEDAEPGHIGCWASLWVQVGAGGLPSCGCGLGSSLGRKSDGHWWASSDEQATTVRWVRGE